jgi:NitT/TauT family transport system permease protein
LDSPLRTRWFRIRGELGLPLALGAGLLCIAVCFGLWWWVTAGEAEERMVSPTALPSPQETFATFPSLWFDRALTRNTWVTLKRVSLGFALAAAVGVPLGILAGCFAPVRAFLAPLIIFGRNIPLAALIPLTFFFFGIGELQKVMFIFIACVAFIISDAGTAVMDVGSQYIDTAYTLGANRRQVILKVLVPLAMPSIFDSARILFGLAFGYIMLAELVRFGNEQGGLGNLINISQRQGPREHIYLIVLIIPVIALAVDRFLFWIQRELFPHRYGGAGLLNRLVRLVLHGWDDFKNLFRKSSPALDRLGRQGANKPQ